MPRSIAQCRSSRDLAGKRGASGRRSAHADDGADREQIARRDAQKHLARVAVIEQEAERDGADDAAQVEPGIDEAVDASRRAFGRRGADDQVARGPVEPSAKPISTKTGSSERREPLRSRRRRARPRRRAASRTAATRSWRGGPRRKEAAGEDPGARCPAGTPSASTSRAPATRRTPTPAPVGMNVCSPSRPIVTNTK